MQDLWHSRTVIIRFQQKIKIVNSSKIAFFKRKSNTKTRKKEKKRRKNKRLKKTERTMR